MSYYCWNNQQYCGEMPSLCRQPGDHRKPDTPSRWEILLYDTLFGYLDLKIRASGGLGNFFKFFFFFSQYVHGLDMKLNHLGLVCCKAFFCSQ